MTRTGIFSASLIGMLFWAWLGGTTLWAQADSAILVVASPPQGTTLVAAGNNNTANQIVIPRYWNGTDFPAGSIVGQGVVSELRATAATAGLSTYTRSGHSGQAPVPTFIVTEDADAAFMSQRQQGTTKTAPEGERYVKPILQPLISNVAILGFNDTRGASRGLYTVGGVLAPYPAVGAADVYHGLWVRAQGARIKGVKFYYIPGTALYITRDGNPGRGQRQPADMTDTFIDDIHVDRAHRGIHVNSQDAVIGRITVFAVRDYALRIAKHMSIDATGAVHTNGGSIGVWIEGKVRGGPWYCEQSPINMLIEGNNSSLHGLTFKGPVSGNVNHLKITGKKNVLAGGEIQDALFSDSAVLITNQYNTLRDFRFASVGANKVGVRLTNGTGHVLDRLNFAGSSPTGNVAVQCEKTINDCHMRLHVWNMATGVDLNFRGVDRLGRHNTIIITTSGRVATPVNWPGAVAWQTADDTNIDSNRIFINGLRHYPPVP